ncbi:hypothetical protein B0T17DRAFT_508556 [Bombardia bombarda]|uniref:DUF7924 domain-containing protein n=1 Tax=Bombardia bombarda TaxID=252184 RepID=A0AA39WT97_9PEZI|nr:hypothetical protein B0T17DRAFT_508556 [Bombardia bombarda]
MRSVDQGTTRKRKRVDKSSTESPIQHNGRKRAIDDTCDLPKPSPKRRQITRPTVPETSDNAAADNVDPDDPIDIWRRGGSWAPQYPEPDMDHLLARKRSSKSLRGLKRSNSGSSTTPSDQKPREEKSAQYRDQRYETLLATKGSFMIESKLDVTSESKTLCKNLLQKKQTFPENSLFRDDLFKSTCQKIHNRNEARVIQDISRLIVPSAESLATYGAKHLEILTESVNEGWNNSIPLTETRPQSDYSVGFQRDAFTEEQLEKLAPFIGEFLGGDLSFFMATYYMYFPFLACEVKCGAAALDVADRQNAHSMTLAVRGVVELFRLVKRENEVDRQILAFSISHDYCAVRIYGYYPVIDGKDTKYYRYPIHKFDFTALDGKDKWATYRFTKNVYDTWMPAHFTKICSAIDQLSLNIDFGVATPSESTGLSQGLESLARLEDPPSLLVDEDNNAGPTDTPATSFSKPGPAKRRKSPVKRPQQ